MKITILCVGKIKEAFFREAVGEYVKRLKRYAAIDVIEVADEPTKEQPTQRERAIVLEKEGARLLKSMERADVKIALAINGKSMDSVAFAENIEQKMNAGVSHLLFVIGGSLGLSEAVLNECDERISFSEMTFPHQLMRVILTEQIYRAFRIMRNEPYHK
ncbi:MAG: 23S rRNA (pseudouridine(1915)-N(3))-methyltransferase RlmH [Lachnospiraceae bacterium]|nr:23S rRNA (pseudouridine(1915)-N(3))-methyltransferase RlmH [Lachnospiraceae bacterium]